MDHSQCRGSVCLLCLSKSTGDLSKLKALLIPIRQYFIEDYSVDDQRLPTGVCSTCQRKLYRLLNNDFSKTFQSTDHIQELLASRCSPRSTECSCKICIVAKSNGWKAKALLKAIKSTKTASGTPKSFTICQNCCGQVPEGTLHAGCSKKDAAKNICDLIPFEVQERVANRVFSEKAKALGKNEPVTLKTGGRFRTVLPFSGASKTTSTKTNTTISHEDFHTLTQNAGLSQTQALKVSRDLRYIFKNRKLIERGLKKSFTEKNRENADLFCIEKIDDVTGVFCNDLPELLRRTAKKRKKLDFQGAKVHVGLDSGSGFLKCSVALLYPEDHSPCDKKRRSYESDGLKNVFKNSGVKRLLLAGIAPTSNENYNIVQAFLRNIKDLQIPMCDSVFVGDLKILNVCAGIQSHSCQHPCVFCLWPANAPPGGQYELRTFEGCSSDRRRWLQETGGDRKQLSKYNNCEHEPMDMFPLVGVIMHHVPIPELHLLLGVVNRLYKECIDELPQCEQWARQLHLVREKYFSKTFEGNECKKLLDNIPVLEQICVDMSASQKVWKIVSAFKSFKSVVESCFGQELKPSFGEDIAKFTGDYMAIGIRITPKVHIVMDHVSEFCSSWNCGLGRFSEQSSEGVHREFRRYWERHLIKDTSATRYGPNLLQTVLEYTATHIG